MPFTAVQKKDIRKYLKVPFGFYDLNTRLESMIIKVGNDATDSAEVILWLDRLAVIDEALTGATAAGSSATYGSLKKVDEVEFYPVTDESSASGASAIALVEQGRVLIHRLASALGVADHLPAGDYFGTSRPLSVPMCMG